jgi:hypothetical protein
VSVALVVVPGTHEPRLAPGASIVNGMKLAIVGGDELSVLSGAWKKKIGRFAISSRERGPANSGKLGQIVRPRKLVCARDAMKAFGA